MVNIQGEITKDTINTLAKKVTTKSMFNGTDEKFFTLVKIANALYDIAKQKIYAEAHSSMTHEPTQIKVLAERNLTDEIKNHLKTYK